MRTPCCWALSPPDQRSHLLAERGTGNSPDPGRPPVERSARALQELFLANADRGDNAANDELVAELGHRMRARQVSRAGGC